MHWFKRADSTLLNQNLRLFVSTVLLLTLLSAISLVIIYQTILERTKIEHYQKHELLLEERIDKTIDILNAATIALANNSLIKEALSYEDRDLINDEIGPLQAAFDYWTGFDDYAFHLITFDGRSLYRNYDLASYGQDVSQHPMIAAAMADLTKPVNAISKGGYGNLYRLINIQPVFASSEKRELLGFMTVSQGLKKIVEQFSENQMQYYVFERDKDSDQFVLDGATYFANKPLSDWQFSEKQLDHNKIQLKNDWIFQTHPIYDENQSVVAFHLLAEPKSIIYQHVWQQTLNVFWILLGALGIIILGGLAQLFLLKHNVLMPMRRLTNTLQTIINTERYDQSMSISRNDEIGLVGRLFNQMLQNTDKLIFDLKYQKMAIDQTLIISRADKFGRITDVNEKFCEISGYSREELIGQSHNIIRHPAMDAHVFKGMWQTIQAGNIWQGEIQNLRKDGSSYFVMSYIIPVLNRHNDIQEYLSIREDITEIVALRKSLQDALAEAEKDKKIAQHANQAKSEFLSSMSHELRTPLNAIIGYSQLLLISDLDPDKQLKVENILHSSKHLLSLINDILDFAKLESGKVQFNIEQLCIQDIVEEVITVTATQRAKRGIKLESKLISEPIYIQADKLRLKQVLLNLLSNAVKYNRAKGTITLSCDVATRNNQHYWQISIHDTGVGIAQNELGKVFEPFNRLGHESSNIEGTGIGLSITKDLVEKMHGFIDVDSQQGEWTEFTVAFLCAGHQAKPLLENNKNADAPSKQAPSLNRSVKVLLIDDKPTTMQIAAQSASNHHHIDMKIAPTYEYALEQIQQWQPDFVIFSVTQLNEQADNVTELQKLQKALPDIQYYAIDSNTENLNFKHPIKFAEVITDPVTPQKLNQLFQKFQRANQPF